MIEKKFYNEDSTFAEIQAIKQRSRIFKDRLIWVDELPLITPFSINTNFDQMEFLSKDMEDFVLIINVSNTARPSAKTIRTINQRFLQMQDKPRHCAYITGRNNLTNSVIRFVMYGIEHSHHSVHKNQEEALKKANNLLKRTTYEV